MNPTAAEFIRAERLLTRLAEQKQREERPFLVITLEGAKAFDTKPMAELYATIAGGIVVPT